MIFLARKDKEMKEENKKMWQRCGRRTERRMPFQCYACFLRSHCSCAVMRIAQIAIECILRRLLFILFFSPLVVPVVSVFVSAQRTHAQKKQRMQFRISKPKERN